MTQQLAKVEYRPTEISTEQLGAIFVKSGFFQETKDAAQAIVKILAGRELGFGPIASMQGVYIVKGRVSLSSNLVGAAIQRSGKYRYTVKELSSERCTLIFYGADGATFESTFTMQDAQAAGLAGSATYKQFPRNMLFSRALTNGARWFCPEVFNGPVYTPDELGATVDAEGTVVDVGSHSVNTSTGEVVQEYVPTDVRDVEDADIVRSADDQDWKDWEKVRDIALGLGIRIQELRLELNRSDLRAYAMEVQQQIVARRRQLKQQQDRAVAPA